MDVFFVNESLCLLGEQCLRTKEHMLGNGCILHVNLIPKSTSPRCLISEQGFITFKRNNRKNKKDAPVIREPTGFTYVLLF